MEIQSLCFHATPLGLSHNDLNINSSQDDQKVAESVLVAQGTHVTPKGLTRGGR